MSDCAVQCNKIYLAKQPLRRPQAGFKLCHMKAVAARRDCLSIVVVVVVVVKCFCAVWQLFATFLLFAALLYFFLLNAISNS